METPDYGNGPEVKSVWREFSAGTGFNCLTGDAVADAVVIGGGTTGITTAQLLSESGLKVIVLEAMKVGVGSTGHSTGNLYVSVEEGFDTIKSKYDAETVAAVIASRRSAIDLVEQNISRFAIDCDYRKVPWYLFSANEENRKRVENEFEAAKEAGASPIEAGSGEIPFPVAAGFKIEGQGQYNPLRYVQELAKHIEGPQCTIYENSPVIDIKEEDDYTSVITANGTVKAKYVVHATHTPKGVFLDFHSLLGTYREYGVAVKLASGNYPEGIFWGYFNTNERFSVRSYSHEGQQYLMTIGQPHQVGQKEDNIENINNLEQFLRDHFDVEEVTNIWAGQNYKPADGLPYIGRKSKGSNTFIATGFSTDGLTYGTLSAIIIRDLIHDKETDYTKLFDASRHQPVKAAGKFIKENAINAAEVVKDYIFFKDSKLDEIPADEGKVIEVDGKKVAVYNNGSEYKACSAICTHLGCVVHWNGAEKTWDCPCHASRFKTDGSIIEGPALTPLATVHIKDDEQQ